VLRNVYVTVGFFGALTFKENTLGDVLKNYSAEGGGLAHFIEAIFLFSICMTYPLIIFPMRVSTKQQERMVGPRRHSTTFVFIC
jgi:amino acid permease